jgi:D-glycero-alpha-D-manno-heptose-7-phosphate kinase
MEAMESTCRHSLQEAIVEASAPCRIDFGGTLDIRTFHYPLRHLTPCTVNVALELRTRVRLYPGPPGRVRISSKGFETAEFELAAAPFDHPMGLMFAVAAYFQAGGIHIDIESASPPRSALGGSSVAAVALIAALASLHEPTGASPLKQREVALLAHGIEESVAGIPCGIQDQLGAAYGGANVWHWPAAFDDAPFRKETLVEPAGLDRFEQHLLVAYCGVPHESKNINGRWVSQFLKGEYRQAWARIIACTKKFIDSVKQQNYKDAAAAMIEETALRRRMTPDVFDDVGVSLAEKAEFLGCGARFTGAGGGGCVWALGEADQITRLKPEWERILAVREAACLLPTTIDRRGLEVVKGPI